MTATETVTLDPDSRLASAALDRGDAGAVALIAPTITVQGGEITTITQGPGRAGDITVQGQQLTVTGGVLQTSTHGDGRAGDLTIRTERLTMTDGALIEARTLGDGHAGNVAVTGAQLTLTSGAQIGSSSGIATREGLTTVASGKGGVVTVTATDTLTIAGTDSTGVVRSGIFSETGGPGEAGQVTVAAPHVRLLEQGQISTSTGGDGRAGDVVLQVGNLDVASGAQLSSASGILVGDQRFVGTGAGGTVRVTATETARITGPNSGLSTTTMGGGRGGDILVQAAQVQLAEGATMTAQGTGAGDAGRVALTASGAVQSAHSAVTTSAATGAGGVIQVTAGSAIDLTETELSATVTGGSRPGGSVTLTAPVLTLTGGRVAAETQGAGNAGNVTLQAERVTAQRATLTSSSTATATGDAGTITLQGLGGPGTLASRLTLTGSVVATEATVADGGNIQVLAQGTLRLRDSQLTTAVRSGTGRGGNILIDPDFVILERSQIRADAFGGPGGNIRLVAKGFLTDAESRVSASSAQSVQGTVAIEAFTNPPGLVAPLPSEFVPLATLLSTRCAARLREGRVGTLLVGGRDGLPADPEGGLPSLPIAGGLEAETDRPHVHSVLERLAPPAPGGTSWPLRLWDGPDADCGPGARW